VSTQAVLEDLAAALDAHAEVARMYDEHSAAEAYAKAAAMVRRKIEAQPSP